MDFLQWVSDHLAAIIAAAAFASSFFNRRKLKDLHVDLNSRLSQLIEASGAKHRAEGIEAGRQMGINESQGRVKEAERVEERLVTESERVEDRHVEKEKI